MMMLLFYITLFIIGYSGAGLIMRNKYVNKFIDYILPIYEEE